MNLYWIDFSVLEEDGFFSSKVLLAELPVAATILLGVELDCRLSSAGLFLELPVAATVKIQKL